jgi:hypothetical protein
VAPFLLMNPYPFLTLNHLTVSKTSIAIDFLSLQIVTASEWPHRSAGQAEWWQAWPGQHRGQVVCGCFLALLLRAAMVLMSAAATEAPPSVWWLIGLQYSAAAQGSEVHSASANDLAMFFLFSFLSKPCDFL